MLIDCDDCAMQGTVACDDCVVSVLVDCSPVQLEEAEAAALDNLAGVGLVPRLRLIPRSSRANSADASTG